MHFRLAGSVKRSLFLALALVFLLAPVALFLGTETYLGSSPARQGINLAGIGAVSLLFALVAIPARPDILLPYAASDSIRLHRLLGHSLVVLALLHGVGFLVLEPLTRHEIGIHAPIGMNAGFGGLAFFCLSWLGSRSFDTIRHLFPDRLRFRRVHLALYLLGSLLTLIHVALCSYLSERLRIQILSCATGLCVLVPILLRSHLPVRKHRLRKLTDREILFLVLILLAIIPFLIAGLVLL